LAYSRMLGIAPQILQGPPVPVGGGGGGGNMAQNPEMMSEGQPTPTSELERASDSNQGFPVNPLAGGGMKV